jgi:cell fate regulator YaaT (PSP1 superfamily)
MPLVVGIRFNPANKVYYFDPSGFEDLKPGEYAVVETARGEEVGKVVIPPREVSDEEIVSRLKNVSRRATALDLTQMAYYQHKEQAAVARCKEKIQEHDLPMKIVRAEYNYDGSRLVFFFASEKRVDFRKLVQDLARAFRARIELRQIGVRDEAKLMGGIGKCGLALCCHTWLTDFNPVSIKLAKQQDLPLSPMEISGVCGRLLCCLAYEKEHYVEMKGRLPKFGDVIDTPHGRGRVVEVNVIKESVNVELESQMTIEVSHQELMALRQAAPQAPSSGKRGKRRRRAKS